MEGLAETKILEEMKEMTQNQITTLLDYVKVGERLRFRCFSGEEDTEIVVSKEPDGEPLRQITKVNLENGMYLWREQRTNNDFTNWAYDDREPKAIISAVRIE